LRTPEELAAATGSPGQPAMVLDVGSNEGFFSLHSVVARPAACLFGIEADPIHAAAHRRHADELRVANRTFVCRARLSSQKFAALDAAVRARRPAGPVFDHGFVLSILHWFDFHRTQDEFCRHVGPLLALMRAAFVEIPMPDGDTGFMGDWYTGRDVTEHDVLRACAGPAAASVAYLGREESTETTDAQGRRVFAVRRTEPDAARLPDPWSPDLLAAVVEVLGCQDPPSQQFVAACTRSSSPFPPPAAHRWSGWWAVAGLACGVMLMGRRRRCCS
jgi:hypothetical protein